MQKSENKYNEKMVTKHILGLKKKIASSSLKNFTVWALSFCLVLWDYFSIFFLNSAFLDTKYDCFLLKVTVELSFIFNNLYTQNNGCLGNFLLTSNNSG